MSEQLALILGNIFSGIGMTLMIVSTCLKTKRGMLKMQLGLHACAFTGGILVKGYSGAVQDGMGFLRNLFVLKGKDTTPVKVFFVASAFVLGLLLNNMGWVGFFPVLTSTLYACAVVWDQSNEKTLKIIIIFTSLAWASYGLALQNYVNAIANCMTLIGSIVYLLRHRGEKAWGRDEKAGDR